MTFADLLYKIWAVIYNNKQTILASFVGVLGFVQGSDYVRNVLSPETYGFLMFAIGVVMLLFARSSTGGAVSKVMPASVPSDRGPPPSASPPPGG